MPWKEVTTAEIQSAMILCDHIGLRSFRERFGSFHEARDVHMYWNGRGPYEARPLLAAAFTNLKPRERRMEPGDFTNNDAHDFLIEHFGFERRAAS